MYKRLNKVFSTRAVWAFLGFLALADLARGEGDGPATSQPAEESWNFFNPAPLDEPMVTDRPDFTESTLTVPVGHMQLETGYTFSYDDEDHVRETDQTFPEALLRVGLVEEWELRLAWPGWSLTETMFWEEDDEGDWHHRKDHDDGGTDMSVGFKHHILEQKGLVPDFGIIGEMSLPTGAEGKTSGDVDPGMKLLWSYELTEALALSGNVNFAVPTSDNGRFFQTAASTSLSYSITDWLGSYFEYFGFYPNDRGSDCAHYLNGGFTIPITYNLQFDIRAGFGLNEEADDFFSGAGVSMRF